MNLNINKDDSEINDFLICWEIFGKRPNKILLHNAYSTEPLKDSLNLVSINTFTEIIPSGNEYLVNNKTLSKVDDDIYVSHITINATKPDSMASEVTFFYKNSEDISKIEDLINQVEEYVIDYECGVEKHKLNGLIITNSALDVEGIDLDLDIDDIDFYYNNSTMKSINKFIKTIKKTNKGLSIFYGNKGTGKTSVLKYLSEKLVENTIIYIPNSLIESSIHNPDFGKFLKEFNNLIIVLDDCEFLFTDFPMSNILTSNLLQLVEGLNNNELNIITIFNTDDIKNIDDDILECNCFVDKVYFDDLSVDEANHLATHLGFKPKYKNNTELNNIIKNRKEEISNKKLGFE